MDKVMKRISAKHNAEKLMAYAADVGGDPEELFIGMAAATGDHLRFRAFEYFKYRCHQELEAGRSCGIWGERARKLRDSIISDNLGLVYTCMGYMHVKDVEEVVSEAEIALIDSVDRFDPWRGWKFSTYACNAIFRRIARTLRRKPKDVTIENVDPSVVIAPVASDDSVVVRQVLESGRAGLSKLEHLLIHRRFYLGATLEETAADPEILSVVAADRIGIIEENIRRESIKTNPSASQIAEYKASLSDMRSRKPEEFRLSRERIRQIQAIAMEKIKAALEVAGFGSDEQPYDACDSIAPEDLVLMLQTIESTGRKTNGKSKGRKTAESYDLIEV